MKAVLGSRGYDVSSIVKRKQVKLGEIQDCLGGVVIHRPLLFNGSIFSM